MKFRQLIVAAAVCAAAAGLASAPAAAQTLNVVTAGDQNMVDYVNNYLGPKFEAMNPGVKVRAVGKERDEMKRLRTIELAVMDDPTAKRPALPAPRKGPRKPGLNDMGPGIEAIPARKPGSTLGRPGMRGGFKRKGR